MSIVTNHPEFPDIIETQIVKANYELLRATPFISDFVNGNVKLVAAEDIQFVRSVTFRELWVLVFDSVESPERTSHGNLLVTRLQYTLLQPFRKELSKEDASVIGNFFGYLKRIVYNAAFDNVFQEDVTSRNLTTGVGEFEAETPAEIKGDNKMIMARVFISFTSEIDARTGKIDHR